MVILPKPDDTKDENKVTLGSDRIKKDLIFGQSESGDFKKQLDKYLFRLKENIWMEYKNEKVQLYNYHMERNWGLSQSRNFSLTFPKIPEMKEIVLVFDDVVPGMGRQKITWEIE